MNAEEYEKKIKELETDIATMIPLLQKATGISERLSEAEQIIQTLVDDLSSRSNDYQKDVSKAKKFLGVLDKKDYFYYARYCKIPIYFQPETNEVIGRNVFCNFLLWLIQPFEPLFVSEEGFKIEIEHRTITRDELREKDLLEE